MDKHHFLKAVDVERVVAYRPESRPGYAAWMNLFPDGEGGMFLSFLEIRRAPNPHFEPMSLEFFEVMTLPIKLGPDLLGKSTPDFVFEYPLLRSQDGRNWREIGRSTVFDRHFWVCVLADGSLLRVHGVHAFRYDLGDKRLCTVISRSTDNGNTWREYSTIVEGCFFFGHRFRRLRDGTLIVAGGMCPSFGPGTQRPQRATTPVGVETGAVGVFFLSTDEGKTWGPPQVIVPGEECWEPDFVELANGDLLFINSTSQAPRNTRQYYHKRKNGYIPSPVYTIETQPHTLVPETIVATEDGLIVGARRCSGAYTCSNDEGATWHVIEGAPKCNYQPMIQRMKDGRFICASHPGGDSRFGQHDMHAEVHIFRIEGTLPRPAGLTLHREMNSDKTQYINAYTAVLMSDGKPVANRRIEFRINERMPHEDGQTYTHEKNFWTRGKIIGATTGAEGRATLYLTEYDSVIDIHLMCIVGAEFTPGPTDRDLSPCRSPIYFGYAVTPARNIPNNYPAYFCEGELWMEGGILDEYPEITQLVEKFSAQGIETLTVEDVVEQLKISEQRAGKVLECLCRDKVLITDGGRFCWNPIRNGATPNHPVYIRGVKRICVLDYLK